MSLAAESKPKLAVTITNLEIIELYRSQAEAALQTVRELPRLVRSVGPGLRLKPIPELIEYPQGQDGGSPADYLSGAWLRLDIRAEPDPVPPDGYRRLELTSAARRARADRIQQTLEIATVDALLADAVSRPQPDRQIGNTLYELLHPNELKPDLQDADNLLLLLEPQTANYPSTCSSR
jgi:hypothetical protein